jgi:hypothetical protein
VRSNALDNQRVELTPPAIVRHGDNSCRG